MKKIISFSFFLLTISLAFGQQLDPVKWSQKVLKISDTDYDLVFTANIEDGWYVYSQYLESDDGPIRTSFNFNSNDNLEFIGKTTETGNKKEGFDEMFEMNLVKFGGEVTFVQRIRTKTKPAAVSGYLEFMTCDNERCLPPMEVNFTLDLN
ncbi:MAG: protein-disulfide reductase DsbD N-terminal domain-containing protein [Bacteroidetes bacterium]|jgi:thiol:disulfide interchange protein DsbD|nr:protein-disulfide reductase DsbD N-terminal domain-containing protein [Bacteroidota bacterium]MDF1863538.1 protein-disulfide reductase DsbD family protein [Saprospiraceae bacterium]